MKKDLLKLLDLTTADIVKILDTADQMKYNQKHGLTHHYLEGKTLGLLGLGKIGSTVEQVDNDAIRGMIFKVKHLVKVEEV